MSGKDNYVTWDQIAVFVLFSLAYGWVYDFLGDSFGMGEGVFRWIFAYVIVIAGLLVCVVIKAEIFPSDD